MTADAGEITDAEIRDWARSTGRKVGDRGVLSPALRTEYETHLAQLHGFPVLPADSPVPPAGPERPAERPKPARQEKIPGRVKPPGSGGLARVRAWFNGATTDDQGKTAPKPKKDARPRTPITRLVGTGWSQVTSVMEHINVPVARTMAWQSPYVAVVADDVISGTPVDRILQPIARAQDTLSGAGAMIAMPFVVGAISSPRNDPRIHGLAAASRQQALHVILAQCIDSQLEMFGSRQLAGKIQKSAADQAKRNDEIATIMGMIFADIPAPVIVPDGATEAQMMAAQDRVQRNAQAEADLRDAAAAVKFMPPPPAEPDMRGQAAEQMAAQMAGSAAQAAADAAAAVALAHDIAAAANPA